MQSDLNLGKLGPNTPTHVQGHMKSNPKQSLQLLISHQMRLCFSVKGLYELSYICFSGTWVLGQFGETGPKSVELGQVTEIRPKLSKSWASIHREPSKVLNSTFPII